MILEYLQAVHPASITAFGYLFNIYESPHVNVIATAQRIPGSPVHSSCYARVLLDDLLRSGCRRDKDGSQEPSDLLRLHNQRSWRCVYDIPLLVSESSPVASELFYGHERKSDARSCEEWSLEGSTPL